MNPEYEICISQKQENDAYILESIMRLNEPSQQTVHVILSKSHLLLQSKSMGNIQIAFEFQTNFSIDNLKLRIGNMSHTYAELYFLSEGDRQRWEKQLQKHINKMVSTLAINMLKRVSVGNHCALFLGQPVKTSDNKKQRLAVKVFRKSSLNDYRTYKHFKNQIRILRKINNQNIIKIISVYQSDNSFYICLPFYEGGTLAERHRASPLKLRQTIIVMRQILKGIEYLHQNKIIHRDIKLQNILLKNSQSLDIVLIDFGLAAFNFEKQEMILKCGTPYYVAPQILRCNQNTPYNSKCDIFSAGVAFYYLVTSHYPYTNQNPHNSLQITTHHLKSFNLVNELIRQMLEIDPHKRLSIKNSINKLQMVVKQLEIK